MASTGSPPAQGTIDVANMSLAGKVSPSTCASDPFHQAICNSVAAGVTYTVAAGNLGADASNFVPASFDEVIAVSALNDRDDTFASFSNYGSVIDIAAPGANILSSLNTGGYGYSSGTSMASPHVAGAAALAVASRGRIGPAAVKSALQSTKQNIALPGDPDGINEGVLYVGNGFSTTPPPKATGSLPIVSAVRSASSTSPAYAYDDNPNTSWYTYTSSPPNAAYITFDLGQVRSISSVRYQFRLAGYADRFYIQFSSNGTSYTTLSTRGSPPAGQTQTVNVATSAPYVRFYFVNPNDDPRLGFLAEVDIFGSMSASAADVSADVDATSTVTPTAEEERGLRERTTATPVSTDGSATPTPPARLRGTATPAATAPTGPATDATNEANRTLRGRATGTSVTMPTTEATTPPATEPTLEAPLGETAMVANTRGAGANCRVAPSSDAAVITIVPEGSIVTLNGEPQGDWQAALCAGEPGFVSTSLLDGGRGDSSRVLRGSDPAMDASTPAATRPVDEGAGQPWLPQTPSADGTASVAEVTPTEVVVPPTATATATPAGPTPFPIVASSWTNNSQPATAAYDDNLETAWQTTTGLPEQEAAASFDLAEIKPVGSIRWLLAYPGMADGLSIQVSEDGERWMTITQPRNTIIGEWQTTQANVAARYVRFLFENPTNAAYLGGLVEIEIFPAAGVVQAVIPDPATPEPTPASIREASTLASVESEAELEPPVVTATPPAPVDEPTTAEPAPEATSEGRR